MFPYSSNPYPSFLPSSSSSSSSLFPFPFLNPENASSNSNNNTLFRDPFSIPYIPTHHHSSHPHHHLQNISNIPETLANLSVSQENHNNSNNNINNIAVPMPKQDPLTLGGGSHYGISCFLTKKPAKKDRHSKIYTSQGCLNHSYKLHLILGYKLMANQF
uniref:Mutant CYCLOIDEA 2 n=1 Tax=Lathyrus odoratus TaxID=3859 RepID=A0A2I8B2S6_LATOD|nr:mutant CYCLOIDEA 2 [Lathyrus odoratus]